MEQVFTGDRQLLSGFEVSSTSTSFPDPEPEPELELELEKLEPGLLVYHHHPTPLITTLPPQKLRPIRSTGILRNPNPNPANVTPTPTPKIVSGSATNAPDSSDLGFLPPQHDFYEPVDDSMSAMALLKMKSEMDANFISTFKSQISQLHLSFSSASDGSGDSVAEKADDGGPSGRPKRNKRKRLESFLEKMMAQVIHKQEEMHHRLMEMIGRKERERMLREEEWRRQEMERLKREEEIRAQEAARGLALISLIQKALGQDHLPSVFPDEDDCKFDPNNKRWPTCEVQALITLRAALDYKFHTLGPKAPFWKEVSAAMANMGYFRNAKKCRVKWENINKYFQKATRSSQSPKSYPYFYELDTLYKNQFITTGKVNCPNSENSEQGKE